MFAGAATRDRRGIGANNGLDSGKPKGLRVIRCCSVGQELAHQFGTVVNVKPIVDPPPVSDRGVFADAEFLSNGVIGRSRRHQDTDLRLTARQRKPFNTSY